MRSTDAFAGEEDVAAAKAGGGSDKAGKSEATGGDEGAEASGKEVGGDS